jgi:hypothetical protein
MQTLKSYLYPMILKVRIPDQDIFAIRNKIVYAQPIKIYQGIDNPVQIYVLNQDNKSVDLTDNSMQVNIQDTVNKTVVATYQVEWINIAKGHGQILLDKTTINTLDQRFYKLSVKKTNVSTNKTTPAYIDDNFGVLLDLEILPGYY